MVEAQGLLQPYYNQLSHPVDVGIARNHGRSLVSYELSDGDVIAKAETGTVLWKGKPDGYPAKAILPLPHSEDAVILLDYMAGAKNFANLIRMTPSGKVLWRLDPPETSTDDAYIECRWQDVALVANSWSGYLVEIDVATGKPSSSQFVK